MNLLNIITLLIVISSIFAYINVRFIKLPYIIGLMIMAILCSLLMIVVNYINPTLFHYAENIVEQINFSEVLLNVMLSFLLFAGALHTDAVLLKKETRSILLFSVVGVLVSTFCIATLLFGVVKILEVNIDFIHCLLFGALISPTDPIAVLGILTKANVPKRIEMNIVGESLFNDGIGVVIFTVILSIIRTGAETISFGDVVIFFLKEAIGGLLFGFLLGYMTYRLLRSIDDYATEVLITVAIVMGGYYFANLLHVSGPLAMVVAGLFTGSRTKKTAVSETTRLYLDKFWELIDVIMNAILFVLIGLRLIILPYNRVFFIIGLSAIPILLFARFISIKFPLLISRKWIELDKRDQILMTWGGLRGGLSIAMALLLARDPYKDMLVFITYIIVLFSIIIQGLTVERLARKLYKTDKKKS